MTVRDDLIAAKALIDTPEKWGKYGWSPKGGICLCSLGAVVVAVNGNRNFANAWTPEVLALEKLLAAQIPSELGFLSVASFNDDDNTAHADVMDLFDRAIAAAAPPSNANAQTGAK